MENTMYTVDRNTALRKGRSLRRGEAKLNAKFGNGGVYKDCCFLGSDAM